MRLELSGAGAGDVGGAVAALVIDQHNLKTARKVLSQQRGEARRPLPRALAGRQVAAWSARRPARRIAAWLGAPTDAAAYEAALYDTLRRLDALRVDLILVESPPPGEAFDAARDRLARAAHRDA